MPSSSDARQDSLESTIPRPWSPLAEAMQAFLEGDDSASLVVHTDVSEPEIVPVRLFFRDESAFRPVERQAIARCQGRVLDLGAAAGAAALALQRRGFTVTALDPLPIAVTAMRRLGVTDARVGDAFAFRDAEGYDTVLMLMNGSMVAGTLGGLSRLLTHLGSLVRARGRILMDSTDPRDGGVVWLPDGRYVGELHYQLEFGGRRGPPFPQLFVDPDTLWSVADEVGLATEIVFRDASGAFLSELTRRP